MNERPPTITNDQSANDPIADRCVSCHLPSMQTRNGEARFDERMRTLAKQKPVGKSAPK